MKSWDFKARIDLSISPEIQIKHSKSNAACLKLSRKENVEVFDCEVRCVIRRFDYPYNTWIQGRLTSKASRFHQSKVCSEIFTAKDDSDALLVAQEGMLLLIEVLKKPSLASEYQGFSIFMGEICLPFDKQPTRLTALALASSPIILAFPLWKHFPLRSDLGYVFLFLLHQLTFNDQCSVTYENATIFTNFSNKNSRSKAQNCNHFLHKNER